MPKPHSQPLQALTTSLADLVSQPPVAPARSSSSPGSATPPPNSRGLASTTPPARDLPDRGLVLVACSGGADSLALAAMAARWGAANAWRVGAVVVDHQLQEGSGEVAAQAAQQCCELGLDPVEVVAVDVDLSPAAGGLEAAARTARYQALEQAAARLNAAAILLAHTRNDQAETVLLGLARGSGARSIAGMRERNSLYRRPFLTITRSQTEAICTALGLTPHEDPHNQDSRFTRVRIRTIAIPALVEAVGDRVIDSLARTAEALQSDTDALDHLATQELATRTLPEQKINIAEPGPFKEVPGAIRTRVIRLALLDAGVPAAALTADHIHRVDDLIKSWKGQGPVRVPGDIEVARKAGELVIYPAGPLHSRSK